MIKINKQFALIMAGLVIVLAFSFHFIPGNPVRDGSVLFTKNTKTPPVELPVLTQLGDPARLKIPSINVDAIVEGAGLTPDGSMDAPKNPNNVAWFKLGPRPGEKGSAVMAGHFDGEDGAPAVFNNLYKLRQGDKLSVEDEKGTVMVFVVRESRNYDPNADTSDIFDLNDGQEYLNLITCEGVWNENSGSYSKRLVVFTDKE